MGNYSIEINLDAKCAECGKGGAITRVSDNDGCGLCLKCATKAMDGKGALKSSQAQAVRNRSRRSK